MSGTYARDTIVSVDRSRAEVERTLERYEASAFMYGWNADEVVIQFRAHDRLVKFVITLPDRNDAEFQFTPSRGSRRSPGDAKKAWEQACRQKWRALALVVKAKLEAVDAGIAEFEDEFLAYTVLPSGETVSQWLQPQIDHAYDTASMPKMLLSLGDGQ